MENNETKPLKIGIHCGLLPDPISEQIKNQGFIIDEKIRKFDKTFDSIQVLRFSDLLTDGMYNKILTKFHRQIIRHVAKINKYKIEAISK
jgi:hypothetical protein